jgi:superoxide reductase
MTERLQFYECEECGNSVEVLTPGNGELFCCGAAMKFYPDVKNPIKPPMVEKIEGGFKIKYGEKKPHPMDEEHHFEWVQVVAGKKAYRHFFELGDAPEVEFLIDAEEVEIRNFCNLHGFGRPRPKKA